MIYIYQIAEEDFSLVPWEGPRFVDLQVDFGWRDQPEDLLPAKDVVPDGRPAEVDVKICRKNVN